MNDKVEYGEDEYVEDEEEEDEEEEDEQEEDEQNLNEQDVKKYWTYIATISPFPRRQDTHKKLEHHTNVYARNKTDNRMNDNFFT